LLEVSNSISIPDNELEERFVRASGPGGQNVNKVSTCVELRFDVAHSPALPEPVRARLLAKADSRLTEAGILIIQAQEHRSQDMNRQDARARLIEFIRSGLQAPKKRKKTKPTRGSKERRIKSKKSRAGIKKDRGGKWN
jgi:ribosome-associated protein